jgi:hypothetical protein
MAQNESNKPNITILRAIYRFYPPNVDCDGLREPMPLETSVAGVKVVEDYVSKCILAVY